MKQKITMRKQENMTVEQAFDLFVRKARVKNLSDVTIRTYRQHFNVFCHFMNKEKAIDDITGDTVDEFILYLKSKTEVNEVTINSYLRTIRVFFHFCMDCGYMERFKIAMPKMEKKIKETYTEQELSRLLKKPDLKKCSFTEYKIWAFENYLLGTGNRLASALEVRIGDVDFDSGMIMIRKSKNRKQQYIPLSRALADVLKEYIEIRGGEADDYLFCNVYGEKGCSRSYQQAVREYNLKRNVTKGSCHLFRHTFSKQWILAHGDIFRLQKILGHYDLEMTKEYVQMFGQDLGQDFDQFNPLDRMRKADRKIGMSRK